VASAHAAEITVRVTDKPPPPEVDAPIRARLQSTAIQLLDGTQPLYEFWLASELPLTAKPEGPAKALDALKSTTLLGAVSVPAARRDYRDDTLAAGVYTMRLAV